MSEVKETLEEDVRDACPAFQSAGGQFSTSVDDRLAQDIFLDRDTSKAIEAAVEQEQVVFPGVWCGFPSLHACCRDGDIQRQLPRRRSAEPDGHRSSPFGLEAAERPGPGRLRVHLLRQAGNPGGP